MQKTFISHENPLIINEKELSQNLSKENIKTQLNTCCWHENNFYTETGDYILAEGENVTEIMIVGDGPTQSTDFNLFSDHKPVFAKVNIELK